MASRIESARVGTSSRAIVGSEQPDPRSNASQFFDDVLREAIDRRQALRVGLGSMAVGFLGGATQSAQAADEKNAIPGVHELFTFAGVPVSRDDTVHVPEGYAWEVVYAWGDPVDGVGPKFKADATNTAEEQALQAGMGHDGMEWFAHPDHPKDPNRGLLCMNHEYTDQGLLFKDGVAPKMTAERVAKSQAAHGLSVIDIERRDGKWHVVKSKYARRITANSELIVAGPGAKKIGTKANGTFNNCASGRTPWGTYLACEENFHNVFGTDEKWEPDAMQKRYGMVKTGATAKPKSGEISLYRWWEGDKRFDLKKSPEEPERFGYVVELDPTDPASKPIKRTALGRIRHENAAVTLAKDGRVVVYMGDDEKNEYIYKFVSTGKYDPQDRAANMRLLDDGKLYAAKFSADLSGKWLELKPTDELDAAGVCVYTRKAADDVQATKMDRPEWIAVQPGTGKVYVTLTNNDSRGMPGKKPTDKHGPSPDRANPRTNNTFGHILSWREDGDAAAESFRWDIFLLAGDPQTDSQTPSVNIQGDSFGSPDGLWFDPRGILWIQTDVSTKLLWQNEYKYLGNNMMLAADPWRGVVRRFLTGPRGCEVTGVTMTPDCKTMFVNIQHPGEPADELSLPEQPTAVSCWPDGDKKGRPRPATIAIWRKDGAVIGT